MNNLNYLIGMKEDAAIKVLYDADIWYRVTKPDNVVAVVTADLQLDRVNLTIDNGKVSSATYG